MTGYVVPQHSLEGFFGTLREELILEKADVSITFCIMGVIGMKTNLATHSENTVSFKTQNTFSHSS